MDFDKDNITILLPCYNEEAEIANTIRHYKKCGFKNVLVLDDGSVDKTSSTAKRSGAKVIHNTVSNGFLLTVLRGIYSINTDMALIIDPGRLPRRANLEEFISFGAGGNYDLLFAKGAQITDVTSYLKRRFGIFIVEPNFEVALLGKKILSAAKNDFTMVETHLYFSLIAYAINNKCKIGTYPLGLPTTNAWSRIRLGSRRGFRGEDTYNEFFKYALPDEDKKKFNDSLKLAVISACIGVLSTLLVQWMSSWLLRK